MKNSVFFIVQLVDRVFDESLNFRKIPPVVNAKTADGNGRPNDPKPQPTDLPEPPTITRRRTWSRDEVCILQPTNYFCFYIITLGETEEANNEPFFRLQYETT